MQYADAHAVGVQLCRSSCGDDLVHVLEDRIPEFDVEVVRDAAEICVDSTPQGHWIEIAHM